MEDVVWCAVWTEARSRGRWVLGSETRQATRSGGWHALFEAFDVSKGAIACYVACTCSSNCAIVENAMQLVGASTDRGCFV